MIYVAFGGLVGFSFGIKMSLLGVGENVSRLMCSSRVIGSCDVYSTMLLRSVCSIRNRLDLKHEHKRVTLVGMLVLLLAVL
jgi:uncharacterized membrane protein YuzA (DUF378 family)